MLVLGRRIGERVLVGNGSVTVLEIDGKRQVKLGFDFPRDVPIKREELPDLATREGS